MRSSRRLRNVPTVRKKQLFQIHAGTTQDKRFGTGTQLEKRLESGRPADSGRFYLHRPDVTRGVYYKVHLIVGLAPVIDLSGKSLQLIYDGGYAEADYTTATIASGETRTVDFTLEVNPVDVGNHFYETYEVWLTGFFPGSWP